MLVVFFGYYWVYRSAKKIKPEESQSKPAAASFESGSSKTSETHHLNINKPTQFFLSHNWGNDNKGRDNHARVAMINENFKRREIATWFDGNEMASDIQDHMCAGIENTQVVLVFITENYMEKVKSDNLNDNCKLEFKYATKVKTCKHGCRSDGRVNERYK